MHAGCQRLSYNQCHFQILSNVDSRCMSADKSYQIMITTYQILSKMLTTTPKTLGADSEYQILVEYPHIQKVIREYLPQNFQRILRGVFLRLKLIFILSKTLW